MEIKLAAKSVEAAEVVIRSILPGSLAKWSGSGWQRV